MIKKIVKCDSNGKVNIKDYLEKQTELSSRQIKRLLKYKKITINNKIAYYDNMLKSGDLIEIDLTENIRPDIIAQNIPLDIVYEDEYMLAINKPPFTVMHPTKGVVDNTLANAVAYYFINNKIDAQIRFLNRLDMNTSGIVIIPKSANMHSLLSVEMEKNNIKKYYSAVVEGIIQPEEGKLEYPIGKDEGDSIKRIVRPDGQYSATIYKTLKKYENEAYVELELVTGRTHQIRVHLSHIGHPIIGDELYGNKSSIIKRQALHAKALELTHPISGEELRLKAEIPKDINDLLKTLKQL